MVRTNRRRPENHLGWALLSAWPNKCTAAAAGTDGAWRFPSNTNPNRGKGAGEKQNGETNDPHPQPTGVGCIRERAGIQAGRHKAGTRMSPRCPWRDSCAQPAGHTSSALTALGPQDTQSWCFSGHLPFQNLESRRKLISAQYHILWKTSFIRANVVRRTFVTRFNDQW